MPYSSRYPYIPARRVPYSRWLKMSAGQRAALKAKLNKKPYRSNKPRQLVKRIDKDLSYTTPLFGLSPKISKMFYHDNQQSVTATGGLVNSRFFIANGLYDPDTTGTGHQPLGFDQMMLLYNQYTVVNARIRVNLQNTVASNARVAIWVNPDTTQLTDPARLLENGLVTSTILTGFSGAQYSTQSQKALEYNLDVRKYFGRRTNREMLNDVDLQGTVSSNPSEGVYFGVAAWDPFGAGTVTVYYDVTIEFSAIFFEPRKLTTS